MDLSLRNSATSDETLGESLQRRGVSRRALFKYAAYLGTMMALPSSTTRAFAEGLANARRQSVIWLSFRECTGCTESVTRPFSPTFESMNFDLISLDYHETLQAASGEAAEEARIKAMGTTKASTSSWSRAADPELGANLRHHRLALARRNHKSHPLVHRAGFTPRHRRALPRRAIDLST